MDLDSLPESPEEAAYNAIVNRVQSDATLAGVIKTFQACPFPFAAAPITKLPLIRIEPATGDIESATFQADKISLFVNFVIWVPSRPAPGDKTAACGDARDIMRIWYRLRKVVNFHSDDWLATALSSFQGLIYGGMQWRSTPINYTPNPETKALGGSATLAVNLEIRD